MNLITTGNAGTMESNDIMITVEPSDAGGVQVELTSSVYQQFGRDKKYFHMSVQLNNSH